MGCILTAGRCSRTCRSAEPTATVHPVAKTLGGDLQVRVVSATVSAGPSPREIVESSDTSEPSRCCAYLANGEPQQGQDSSTTPGPPILWTPAQDRAILGDNHGNRYQCVRHAHKDVAAEAASLSPGQSATDTLTFRPLIAPAEQFALYLPTRNFGQDGALTIQIPKG